MGTNGGVGGPSPPSYLFTVAPMPKRARPRERMKNQIVAMQRQGSKPLSIWSIQSEPPVAWSNTVSIAARDNRIVLIISAKTHAQRFTNSIPTPTVRHEARHVVSTTSDRRSQCVVVETARSSGIVINTGSNPQNIQRTANGPRPNGNFGRPFTVTLQATSSPSPNRPGTSSDQDRSAGVSRVPSAR